MSNKNKNVFFEDNIGIDCVTSKLFGINEPENSKELFESELYSDIVDIINQRTKTILTRKQNKSFGKCKNCKSESLSLFELQTRSADEAKDFLLKCNRCGYTCHSK